jgi:hypothetical protein
MPNEFNISEDILSSIKQTVGNADLVADSASSGEIGGFSQKSIDLNSLKRPREIMADISSGYAGTESGTSTSSQTSVASTTHEAAPRTQPSYAQDIVHQGTGQQVHIMSESEMMGSGNYLGGADVGRPRQSNVPTIIQQESPEEEPQPGGWTGSDALANMSVSSNTVVPNSLADIENAQSSDRFDRQMARAQYGGASMRDIRNTRAEGGKQRRDAHRLSRHLIGNEYTPQADGNFSDPFRRKYDIPVSEMPSSNRLYSQAVKTDQNSIKSMLSRNSVGGRVWAKILAAEDLAINEVGLGIGELEAVIEQDPSQLYALLGNLFPDGPENHDVHEIALAINTAANQRNGSEIRVGVSKPPDVNISDAQSMVLRILTDRPRGIFIHPLAASLFNADFDGDDANLSFDKKFSEYLRDTIDLLIDPDGTTHLDEKWFTTVKLVDGLVDGLSREEVITLIMFDKVPVNDAIIESVLELGDNLDPKRKNELLVNLLREIRAFVGSDNKMFERILHDVYRGFQRINRKIVAESVGTFVERTVDPVTDDDRIALDFVNDLVEGKIPNNWFDFKRAFNAFVGDVREGNSDFRISASVGKRFKLNSDLIIGGEYVIKLSNESQVNSFLQCTMEYAMAEAMSHEFKREGRSYQHTRQLAIDVVSEVGFPDSTITTANGTERRYANTAAFLHEFIRVYTREALLTNEANLITRANMQISQASNRNVVASIEASGERKWKDEDKVEHVDTYFTYGDVVDAMVSVYGEASVERMFKNIIWRNVQPNLQEGWSEREVWEESKRRFGANSRYRSFSIRRFSKDNHMIYNGFQQSNLNGLIIPVQLQDGSWLVEDYVRGKDGKWQREPKVVRKPSDNRVEMYLLRAIADMKTSSESAYATRVYGYVDTKEKKIRTTFRHDQKHTNAQQRKNEETDKYYDESGNHKTLLAMRLELLRDIKSARNRGGHDMYLAIGDIVRLICASGPEMFSYFGMDSVDGWESSEYARAMENCDTVDILGGINMAMHYSMRTNPIYKLDQALRTYRDAPGMAQMQMQTQNEIAFKEQELASSSQTWQGIMMERKTGLAWQELPQLATQLAAAVENGETPSTYLEAQWYWEKPAAQRHQNIDELMRDLNFGFAAKRDILCDIVRMHTGDSTFKSYEVCMQLEVGASGEWKLGNDGRKQLFETYNNLERMFNQYGDTSYQNMVDNVEHAFDMFGTQHGALMSTIRRLAEHPAIMCHMGFDTMADAVCSVMDRLYDQTEKAKTHPWSNEAYQGLSLLRNGGYYNEMYQTDDLIVGTQHVSQVSAMDLIRVFNDPSFVLTVYNDIGQVIQVNRDQLLGFERGDTYDVEKEVWRFLRDNPRIAGCLRMQSIAVSATDDAKAYVVAACDTAETISRCTGMSGDAKHDTIDDIAYLMFDHPGFHGLASLITPAFGRKSVFRSPSIAKVERYLCYVFYKYSTSDKWEAARNADRILNMLGITSSNVRNALMSDYDYELISNGIDLHEKGKLELDSRTEEIISNCRRYITNYLIEIGSSDMVDHKAKITTVDRPAIMIDPSSAQSFYDVIQELSGAKTQVSTGIEGYETFQFHQWSALTGAKDRYASLLAIQEDVETDEWAQKFNGALTSGGVLMIVDGKIANLEELEEASEQAGYDELVVMVPDGYEVDDKTIDSRGRTISSQQSYMMSKRAEGAEGHNLKVMKTGIDDLDSITKIGSKYFRDSNGAIVSYDSRVGEIREAAKAGATDEDRLFLAKLCLAKSLLESNRKIGYKGQTLANYMSIADLMVILGDDGEIYVRSLAQLYTAMKHRIGVQGDAMSRDQRLAAANAMINDTSQEGCIGRMAGFEIEAFDSLRPVRVSPSSRGIYSRLSNQAINRRALDGIVKATGVSPMSSVMREKTEREMRSKHKWINKVLKDAFILRQYHVVGCIDAKSRDNTHDVGMSALFVIGNDAYKVISLDELERVCNKCYEMGETILISAEMVEMLPQFYFDDAMPCVTDSKTGEPTWYTINTFNMRVNGAEAAPYKPVYAMAQYPYDKDMYFVEDSFGEFDYGDSGARITSSAHDRFKVSRTPKSISINAADLFSQQFNRLGRHGEISVSFVDQAFLDRVLNHEIEVEIDLGVVEGADGFDRRKKDIDAAIERYRNMTDDGDGKIINQDCHAGDIVAWALAEVSDVDAPTRYVLAPIIPYPLHGTKRGMETFQCTDITYLDDDHTRFAITMMNTADFDGYAKAFLPSGGADKVTIDLSRVIEESAGRYRTLMDGRRIDGYVDARTTGSRRIGTQNRLRTMETLIREARRNGYNFAYADGAFPEASRDPRIASIKEALKRYPPPSAALWNSWVDVIRFHTDPTIDAFVRMNCKKCLRNGGNPSHFLASQFIDPTIDESRQINSMYQWEYIPSFENSLTYEDAFLKFFHLLNPSGAYDGEFCPNGIDDDGEDYLFRLKKDANGRIASDYDLGVLQMKVPHMYMDLDGNGEWTVEKWVYTWECVFSGTGFFGEDYSAGSRPNVEGASRMSDVMTMLSNTDVNLSESDSRLIYGWSTADLTNLSVTGSAVTLWN